MQHQRTMNAVLLAGGRRASIELRNQNKAFLKLNGVPLFIHVYRALTASNLVGDVIVVGPADELREALDEQNIVEGIDPVVVLEQRDNMVENFKAGYVAALGLDASVGFNTLRNSEHVNTPVLVSPCDIPLLTPAEVDEFILRSNLHEYEYSIGITSAQVLSRFHPKDGVPGIRMIYFHVKEDLMRHNNLHIGQPLKFAHLDYIEKMYEWRYQTRLANIVRMLFSLLFRSWRLMMGLRIFILMQLSLYYDRHGHPNLSDRVRSHVGFNRLAEGIGNALGARVQMVYTHFGGAALDADNEKDLAVIEQRYDEWMAAQQNTQV